MKIVKFFLLGSICIFGQTLICMDETVPYHLSPKMFKKNSKRNFETNDHSEKQSSQQLKRKERLKVIAVPTAVQLKAAYNKYIHELLNPQDDL